MQHLVKSIVINSILANDLPFSWYFEWLTPVGYVRKKTMDFLTVVVLISSHFNHDRHFNKLRSCLHNENSIAFIVNLWHPLQPNQNRYNFGRDSYYWTCKRSFMKVKCFQKPNTKKPPSNLKCREINRAAVDVTHSV